MSLVPLVAGPFQGYVLCGCELSMLFAAFILMCGIVLPFWLFGLLEPTDCCVGPDHSTEMGISRRAHIN